MRRKLLYLAALALPLLFLGVQAACLAWHKTNAPAYRVAIDGYDPRDLVYGEYLQFRFLWDDSASQKPDQKDLPETGRVYLPEGNAWDLQTMMWERKQKFDVEARVMGSRVFADDLRIDGKPWQESLAAWRETQQNAGQ